MTLQRSSKSIRRVENVAGLEEVIRRFVESWIEINPLVTDEDAYIGQTQDVPAGAEVIVIYNLMDDYNYYIKKVYADAVAGVSYKWKFTRLVGYGYLYERTLYGNEHEFTKRLIARRGGQIILTITNPTVYDYTLDIIIDMWARRAI